MRTDVVVCVGVRAGEEVQAAEVPVGTGARAPR